MHSTESISRLFNGFNNLRVLVIGDVMVDAYLFGKVERISPEAPVPVVAVQHRSNRPGGAANVALNIKALGAEPILCSVIGKDQKGTEFLDILRSNKLPVNGILESAERITTTKFRVIGNKTQMLRVDEEMTTELNRREKALLIHRIEQILEFDKIDVVVFQDYNKGVISAGLISRIVGLAREKKIPTVVDPKHKNFLNYRNVDLFKPNLKELFEGINMRFESPGVEQVKNAAIKLQQKIEAELLLVTLSEKGVFIRSRSEENEHLVAAHLRNIADVSGAGDTVLSVAALCMALKQDAYNIAAISNIAGGLVCEEVGVVPIDKNKLHDEVLRVMIR